MLTGWIEYLFFTAFLFLLIPLLGTYLVHVFAVNETFVHRNFGWLERLCYRIGGVNTEQAMSWKEYAKALFLFNLCGFIFLFLVQLFQGYLPLNPQHFGAVHLPLAFNNAASFITNTDWQAYSGETTLSYFTQMAGLTALNFFSAATGMCVLLVLVRGLIGKGTETLGNFWVDCVRTIVYVLLPLSIVFSIGLVEEGVIQTLSPYQQIETLEKHPQTIPLGPVASQVAIKQLGTNGGGFFNANSAHPYENPTSISNFFELLAIVLLPASLVYFYGAMIGSLRHGWLILFAMFLLWFGGFTLAFFAQNFPNATLQEFPVLEGEEARFSLTSSSLWSVTTTAIANGSVNAMISSQPPLTGGMAMLNMMLGELVFGGVGVGLASMIMMVLLTVFLSGLMVGRTPEYLGKRIEKKEMQWVVLAVLMPSATTLIGAGLSCVLPGALKNLSHHGPHGLSELLYAFTSCAANNGSSFAGLNADTSYFNWFLGVIMLITRTSIILPSLAIAGLLVNKKTTAASLGTFSTNSLLFVVLLISIILIVGALAFFPALSLGPILEHLLMIQGRSF